jgi:glycerophosphoryl diester phosphodiesterase
VSGVPGAPAGGRAFDLQGHRGARGLEPENSLPAFARALAIGVTTLELDLGMTRDGVLVVSHDRRLHPERTRDATGAFIAAPGPLVHELTYAELQRYDVGRLRPGSAEALRFPEQRGRDGVRVPALADLLALVRRAGNGDVRFNVETKLHPLLPREAPAPEAFADALVRLLREERLTARATVQSFDWRTLRRVQAVAPEIATVALTVQTPEDDNLASGRSGRSPWLAGLDADDFAGSVPRLVQALGTRVWSPYHGNLTPAALREAHALGLRVIPWTVNEPAQMSALIALGVDGLISDYPDRLRAAAARAGLSLPAPSPAAP